MFPELSDIKEVQHLLTNHFFFPKSEIELSIYQKRILIYKQEAEIVGALFSNNKKSKIYEIYVKPKFRRMGIGKILLDEFINLFSPCLLSILAVEESLPFWEKYGFRYVLKNNKPLTKATKNKILYYMEWGKERSLFNE